MGDMGVGEPRHGRKLEDIIRQGTGKVLLLRFHPCGSFSQIVGKAILHRNIDYLEQIALLIQIGTSSIDLPVQNNPTIEKPIPKLLDFLGTRSHQMHH